jgi:hypothetical protein
MGFQVKVEGKGGGFEISRENILTVEYKSDIPADSNARSKDQGATLTVTGKILTGLEGLVGDATIELGKWSLVPAESAEAYRNLTVDVLSANQVVRSYTLPNAFVIDYKEDYKDSSGVGVFTLVARQKKDKLATVAIEGGYAF